MNENKEKNFAQLSELYIKENDGILANEKIQNKVSKHISKLAFYFNEPN